MAFLMNTHIKLALLAAVLIPVIGGVAASADKGASTKVSLREASWKQVEGLIKKHRGKVVVVDIWTTTCPCCVEKMPEFVALVKKFGRKRIACISVNCDYDGVKSKPPKFYRAGVLKVLKKHNAAFDNVMLNVSFLNFLESMKLESTPAVYVYGADGKLAKRFDNDNAQKEADEFGMDDVVSLIQRLLAR